jgi:hypothetical protein
MNRRIAKGRTNRDTPHIYNEKPGSVPVFFLFFSDSSIVPEKSPNKVRQRAAEGMEGRGLAKGNPL